MTADDARSAYCSFRVRPASEGRYVIYKLGLTPKDTRLQLQQDSTTARARSVIPRSCVSVVINDADAGPGSAVAAALIAAKRN